MSLVQEDGSEGRASTDVLVLDPGEYVSIDVDSVLSATAAAAQQGGVASADQHGTPAASRSLVSSPQSSGVRGAAACTSFGTATSAPTISFHDLHYHVELPNKCVLALAVSCVHVLVCYVVLANKLTKCFAFFTLPHLLVLNLLFSLSSGRSWRS